MAEVRVTQTGVYVESEGSGVLVSQAGAYAELVLVELRATEFGVYAELSLREIRATQFGVYAELVEEVPMATYVVQKMGRRSQHKRLPDEVTGYALDPGHSWWSVLVPEATENLLENPSFERGFDNYSTGAWDSTSIVSGDAVGSTRGAYALQMTNTATVEAFVVTTTPLSHPAGAYTISMDVYIPRIGARLFILDGNNNSHNFIFHRAGWQRIEATFVKLAAGVITFSLRSPTTNTVAYAFRTDGWQLENKKYATSYADGDMTGWFDTRAAESYYWTGVPHASSSVRKANTGTGGRTHYFSDLVKGVDFKTTAIVGAGMGPVELDAVRVGYEREIQRGVRFLPRDFTITGRIIGCSWEELYQARQAMITLLRPNRTLRRQPLILRYQVTDEVGNEMSLPLEIIASYTDGLRGNSTNIYQEAIGLQFHASNPYWMEEFESALDLGAEPYEELVSNRIIYRDADGVYQNLGVGTTNAAVSTVAFDAAGVPLAGGVFTTLAGDAVDRIAKWNGTDWVNIDPGGGMNDDVNVIRVIPETNYILAGGEFTLAGGVTHLRIAYFDGVSWERITSVETGFSSGQVNDLVYDRYSGRIFAVGASNNGASFTYYAEIGDAAWTSLPNGGLSSVSTVLSTHDGNIWIGGSFTQTVDTTIQANRVIRYNIDTNTFTALDAGFNGTVKKLIAGRDGYVYAMGGFSMDGDDNYDLRGLARWNGSTWEEVLEIASLTGLQSMTFDANNVLWYANNSVPVSTSPYGEIDMAGYSNGVFYSRPFVQPADAEGILDLVFGPNNEMLLSIQLSSASPTLAPKQYTVEVSGDADALPIVILRGAQTPKFIQNLDGETGIYFRDNFKVVEDERLFLNFSGTRPRFYTDARPNLTRHIYTGASNLSTFILRPGVNRIMLLCTDVDALVENSLVWRNRFLSSDAVTAL